MKVCVLGLKPAIGILSICLLSATAFAAGAVVDCTGATPGAFTTITAALASLPAAGPNSISVTGACTETVFIIGRTDLTIFGNPSATVLPPNPNARTLVIVNSRAISIQGITFDGGRGVFIFENSRASFDTITVKDSAAIGITSLESQVNISNATVKNSVRSGISVSGGFFSVDGGVSLINNGRFGIAAGTTHLSLNGGDGTPGTENIFSNNGSVGVGIFNGAQGDVNGDNRINSNGSFGMEVIHNSTLSMSDGTISSNVGAGVHCGETSHCEWSGSTHINTNGNGGIAIVDHSDAYLDGGIDISGNTHNGVYVDLSSVYNSLGGNTINNNTGDGVLLEAMAVAHYTGNDTMTGNTVSPLECDSTSLVVGDVASLGKIKCKNVQPQSPTMLTQP